MLNSQPSTRALFPRKQIVSYKIGRAAKAFLCTANLSRPPKLCKGCFQCPNESCWLHAHLIESNTVRSAATGESFPVLHHLNCNSSSVIYLVSCERCSVQGVGECQTPLARLQVYHKCVATGELDSSSSSMAICRHFVESPHTLVDLHFQLIDFVPTSCGAIEAVHAAIRTRLESAWINRPQTALNVRRNLRSSFPGGASSRNSSTGVSASCDSQYNDSVFESVLNE